MEGTSVRLIGENHANLWKYNTYGLLHRLLKTSLARLKIGKEKSVIRVDAVGHWVDAHPVSDTSGARYRVLLHRSSVQTAHTQVSRKNFLKGLVSGDLSAGNGASFRLFHFI